MTQPVVPTPDGSPEHRTVTATTNQAGLVVVTEAPAPIPAPTLKSLGLAEEQARVAIANVQQAYGIYAPGVDPHGDPGITPDATPAE